MINNSYLALLYYNLIYENKYNIENKKDLRKAYKAFANSNNISKEILLQAIALYNELLAKEFDNLLATKSK
jgi:hypothetical protein